MDSNLEEKVILAQTRLERVLDHLLLLIDLHEINQISYGTNFEVPTQIARSFRIVSSSLYKYELIRLYALWDIGDGEEESLSVVAKHAADKNVRRRLKEIEAQFWNRSVDLDAEDLETEKLICDSENHFGAERAIEMDELLEGALLRIEEIKKSPALQALKENRDKFLAHALNKSRAEIKNGGIRPWSRGMERELIDASVSIASDLLASVGKKSFDLDAQREKAAARAVSFWSSFSRKQISPF